MKLCCSWWNFPNIALHLPLAASRITLTVSGCMLFEYVSAAQKWIATTCGSVRFRGLSENGSEQKIRHCMTRHVPRLFWLDSASFWLFRVRFCCPCFLNERRHFRHFAGICGFVGLVGGSVSLSLSSVSVVRASSAKEDNLGTLPGFAAVLGSFGEASLSSIPVVCASSTNEGNFRGIYALDGRTPSIQEPTMEQYRTIPYCS